MEEIPGAGAVVKIGRGWWKIIKDSQKEAAQNERIEQLEQAYHHARNEDERPSLIIVDSHIAYGAPNKQDTSAAHGEPLGEDEIRATKERYGWDPDQHFAIPDPVKSRLADIQARGAQQEADWQQRFNAYRQDHPELAQTLDLIQQGSLPEGWDQDLPTFPADE